MLNLKVIVGSTRPNRFSEQAAAWVKTILAAHQEFAVEFLDLRDYQLPFYDQPISPSQVKDGNYANPTAKAWGAKIAEGDVFLIVAPEYNHSMSAVIKNAFDSVYKEWNNKAIGFVSYGTVGGARSVEQMRLVAGELQMADVRSAVHIIAPWMQFDDKGVIKAGVLDQYAPALETMLGQLKAWGEALKGARQCLS